MHRFRNLAVWHAARAASIRVYSFVRTLPPNEQYEASNQLRRAAISVAANIAEGSKRSDREFARFVDISAGSAAEVWTMLDLCPELRLGDAAEARSIAAEYERIERMLASLKKHLLT